MAANPPTIDLDLPISRLASIGPRNRVRLEKLGISTVRDLLFHLPRRYEDTRDVVPLRSVNPGGTYTVHVRVREAHMRRSPRKGMMLVEAVLEDDGAVATAIWFNQPFIAKQLFAGMELMVSGRVEVNRLGISFRNPVFEPVAAEQQHVGRLAPVYPETEGLTSRFLRSHIEPLLDLAEQVEDVLPPEVLAAEGLMRIAEALRCAHHPSDQEQASAARERLAFEELFLLQLAAERARRRRLSGTGAVVPYDPEVARDFVASLPFALTEAQRKAAHQILTDMADTGPMNRLLQGDVGSGKTVVGAMAALIAHRGGFQTAVMAPTEILARQHYATLERLLTPLGAPPRRLVGSTPDKARREILDGLAGGHDALVVGTHALLEDEVIFANLGLVIVDEQHRFGVAQRQRLRLKAMAMPNFLAMSATPIPRSLALTLYGDVNGSEIREMPPGRTPVLTRVVPPDLRGEAYDFIRAEVAAGRQVFVICPLIEESDKLGVKSATAEFERLSTVVFPDLRVELLHGRLPSREKDERMTRFASGATDILVATSVVEVGVDVANATVMLIEAAERFGIAQLHQFRGRVGRGGHQSHCLLFETASDLDGSKRLEAVAQTQSGFDLAELDLRLRGPGDIAGMRQHGLPEMRAADLLDIAMAQRTRAAAATWLDADPDLTAWPPLAAAMNDYRAVFDLD